MIVWASLDVLYDDKEALFSEMSGCTRVIGISKGVDKAYQYANESIG